MSRAGQAVVLGGSVAGLLAASVLANHFDRVLILERDRLSDEEADRKGTPQARHAHGLLAGGQQAIETMLPGMTRQCHAQGALLCDLQADVAFYAGNHGFARAHAGIPVVAASRRLLEQTIRQKVSSGGGVTTLDGTVADGLIARSGKNGPTVSGVVALASGRDPFDVPADLVVDATGRGSRLPHWLREMGCEAPHEDVFPVDIRTVTAYLRREPGAPVGTPIVVCSASRDQPRPGVLIAQEDQRWVVAMAGYGDDSPPLDRSGFVARAQSMASPELARIVSNCDFLSEPTAYRFAAAVRRRYERISAPPDGVVALGDAVCSLNPIYGQGISCAALQAHTLGACLDSGLEGLPKRFHAKAARVNDGPWHGSTGADAAVLGDEYKSFQAPGWFGRYLERLTLVARDDPAVAGAFLSFGHLLTGPLRLFSPDIAWRVLRGPATVCGTNVEA